MQGALGYSSPHDPCNKHFVTVSKKGLFFGRGSSVNTKQSMSSVVETFCSRGKIRSRWMWGRPRFWYSLVQMFPITLANHAFFATPLKRAFTFIWNMRATESGRLEDVWLGSSFRIISYQFELQLNVRKTSEIPLLRTIAIASWYTCIMKHGESRNETRRTIHWPTFAASNWTSCSNISASPW